VAELEAQITAALAPAIEVEGPADFGISMEPLPQPEAATPAEAPPAAAEPAAAAKSDVLGDFVSDLEESLGSDFTVAAPAPAQTSPSPAVPVAEAPPSHMPQELQEEANSVLADMFAEFKEDAEAGATEVDDPETHYNLGVAFREMGLLDEAIGELQKVCHAIDQGASFTQVMQAYTWLAQCLVDKGAPGASFRWYEKALSIATDEQQRLSINYDLASAYEAAGNRPSALQHFMEVYGSNIDYRDVAERIKALRS
jgi:tetratricopeptide (TPR) repeat protein